MPPKLTPERIQEKLVELRAYVTDHAGVLRTRPGDTVVQKLRQHVSKEEKGLVHFLDEVDERIHCRAITASCWHI